MKRLFGSKKKETPVCPPIVFNPQEHAAKLDAKLSETDNKIKQLDLDIQMYHQKYKSAKTSSEKQYLEQRLKNLLARRKMISSQGNRLNNNLMMMERVSNNLETANDMISMGQYMEIAVNAQKNAMKNFNFDKFQDQMDDAEDLARESDYITDIMNRDFEVDIDDELNAEFEALDEYYADDKNKNVNLNISKPYNPLQQ